MRTAARRCSPIVLGMWLVGTAVALETTVDTGTAERVRAWRRDLHQHPELGNRETRTAALVARELTAMGYDVRTGVAYTGVLAYLRGAAERPLLALRADMDALPVTENTGLPFASTVTTEFRGQTVGVMHACGHDAHVAILLGAAARLAAQRDRLGGSLLLLFQPAEEGPPEGEEGGAPLMLKEGAFAAPRKPDAIVGLHVFSTLYAGEIGLRSGPIMAESDSFQIQVQGVQTHGSRPWGGVDPILAAARIVDGLQSIVSRRVDLTANPAVVTVGAIKGGIRYNIIPDQVEVLGTVRSFDEPTRLLIFAQIEHLAQHTARAHGATSTVRFGRPSRVTVNDPGLTARLQPALARAVAPGKSLQTMPPLTIAEDFAFYANEVPGFYFFVGATAPELDPQTAPGNHSDKFTLDEAALEVGVRALLEVTAEFFGE